MEPTINASVSAAPLYSNCFDEVGWVSGKQRVVPVLCRHRLSPGGVVQWTDPQPVSQRTCQPSQQLASPLQPVTETACSDNSRSCQSHCEALPLEVCRSGNTAEFRRLLADNPGIAQQWFHSADTGCAVTLLHIAARHGHKQILQALLKAGADRHATCGDMTALFLAVSEGHEACWLALLSAGANPDAPRKTGATPLICAAMQGNPRAVKTLINARANIHLTFMGGLTALHISVLRGDNVPVALTLINAGADCNAIDDDGETPLFIAIREGSVKCAQMLIENGASLDIASDDGTTPLYLAVKENCEVIVQALLKAGATANPAPCWDGTMPLHLAVINGNKNITKALIKNGADPDVADGVGTTPLYIAAREGHEKCLKALLKAGANTNIPCFPDGATPLSVAARNDQLDSVRMLLKAEVKKK